MARDTRNYGKRQRPFDAQTFHKGGPVLADKKKDEFASKRAYSIWWHNERDRIADEAGYDDEVSPEDRPYSIMGPKTPVTPSRSPRAIDPIDEEES